jgi:uncharacterized protein DUF1236
MRMLVIAAATALMMATPIARSQAPSDQPAPPPSTTVNLTMEQRHVIKEVVKDLHLPKASGDVPVSIGATVPQSIPLQAVPSEIGAKVPQVKSHRFFVTTDRIVLVNPNDARIAEVIE